MPVWDIGHVNYLAVLVAGVAAFLVGGVWYGAVFAKTWVRLHAYTDEDAKAMQKGTARAFAIFFATDLVRAWLTALCFNALHVTTVAGGVCAATTLWLAYAATFHAENYAAHRKPLGAFLLDAGYQIIVWRVRAGWGIVARRVSWEVMCEPYVAVVSGWGGAVPLWGGDVAKKVSIIEQGGSVWVFKLMK